MRLFWRILAVFAGLLLIIAVAIGDLAIKDGTLTYRDGETSKVTTVAIESLALHARDASSPVSARFRGKVNDLAIALEGDLGPLDALVQRNFPYPVSLKGEISGKSATLATKVRVERQVINLDELRVGLGQSSMTRQASTASAEGRQTSRSQNRAQPQDQGYTRLQSAAAYRLAAIDSCAQPAQSNSQSMNLIALGSPTSELGRDGCISRSSWTCVRVRSSGGRGSRPWLASWSSMRS